MIVRDLTLKLQELMPDFPTISIHGSRQVGRTTLAQVLEEIIAPLSIMRISKGFVKVEDV